MNCQPILDCFIPIFNLKYEDSENIKMDRVNTVLFNRNFFLGHPVELSFFIGPGPCACVSSSALFQSSLKVSPDIYVAL